MTSPVPRPLTTLLLTALALVCFAANSVLCRLALGAHAIDAASFTAVRLAAGAALLGLLRAGSRRPLPWRGSIVQPVALFVYAAAFSFAYVSLSAGTGALVLFGAVQLTMILVALRSGERFRPWEAAGLVLAAAGLVYLVLPGVSAPSPFGCAIMAAAGVAWGVYSLRGRGSRDAIADTTRNFLFAAPLAILLAMLLAVLPALGLPAAFAGLEHRPLHASTRGVLLAAGSGAISSGLGYIVWFSALRGLTALQAATVQLAVPAIAATGGVVLLGEQLSPRLLVAAMFILGGIALALAQRTRAAQRGRLART